MEDDVPGLGYQGRCPSHAHHALPWSACPGGPSHGSLQRANRPLSTFYSSLMPTLISCPQDLCVLSKIPSIKICHVSQGSLALSLVKVRVKKSTIQAMLIQNETGKAFWLQVELDPGAEAG